MRVLFNTVLLVSMVFAGHGVQAQQVYKWVDAEGKTHYDSQPPAGGKEVDPLKLNNASSFGGNNSPSSRSSGQGAVQYNADGSRKIPRPAQEMGDDLLRSLKKVDPKTSPLSCSTAVGNVRSQLETMLEVGQRNVRDGYMSADTYEAQAPKLRQAMSETTVADCESASGNKRAFYQCMSSDRNHLAGCGSKYKF